MKNDELVEIIDDRHQLLMAEISCVKDILKEISAHKQVQKDLESMKNHLAAIDKNFDRFEKSILRTDEQIKAVNGAAQFCRAVFKESKENVPQWYILKDISPPESGTVWIQDIEGNQTLARCEGKAIIYPAGSALKSPKYWKPS